MLTLFAASSLLAASTIYKCTSAGGQVRYSPNPCAKTETSKPVRTTRAPSTDPNQALQSIGEAAGKAPSSGVQAARNARSRTPEGLQGACLARTRELSSRTDQDMANLTRQYDDIASKISKNTRFQEEAKTSAVGAEWLQDLQTERAQLDAEKQNVELVARQVVEAETSQLGQILAECNGAKQ